MSTATMPKLYYCQNGECLRFTNRLTNGLCRTCYEYKRRTGKMRTRDRMLSTNSPLPLIIGQPAPPRVKPTCSACKQTTSGLWKGRCQLCYAFWRKNDRDRTPEEFEALKRWRSHKPTFCANPKCSTVITRPTKTGRCQPCQDQFRKNGRDRTPHHTRLRPCANCGKDARDKQGHQRLTHGRCTACAYYLKRYGCERPPDAPNRFRGVKRPPIGRATVPTVPCVNCTTAISAFTKTGRCKNCASFLIRNGRERTIAESKVWNGDRPHARRGDACEACNQPLRPYEKGRACHGCLSFRRKHGRDRTPDELARHRQRYPARRPMTPQESTAHA